MPAANGKILVIRGGAIGDFILTIPVFAALRQQFPGIEIELLGYPRLAQLAKAAGLVDRAEPIDARPLASFFARGGPLPSHLADYFNSFALIISYLFDPNRIFQENVARCSKAHFMVGPHRPDEHGDLHATDAFLRPLARLAIFDPDPVPKLRIVHADDRPTRLLLLPPADALKPSSDPLLNEHWIALHPGSGSERKNWPEERWAAFLRYLNTHTTLRFLLVGGEAEGERLLRLASTLPSARVKLAQSLPLADLSTLLQQCWAYVGHDSGISHLAAALGLRGLILWGPSRHEVWRPRSERMRLLHSDTGLHDLEVDQVLTALRDHLV